jgi:hypothetical protein
MNKLFWLSLPAILCCFTAASQLESNDSTLNRVQAVIEGKDSLIMHFACVVKDHSKIMLQWKADSIDEGNYFVVEHSNDGNHYETVGALKVSGNQSEYELIDDAPFGGSNFYRIRYTGKTGQPAYSRTLQVVLSQNTAFKFYPNPVDKLLIIQTDHRVVIQILSSVGAVLISKQLQPGVQVINVSTLEKGNYLLRVTDKESNRDMLEQLLKN